MKTILPSEISDNVFKAINDDWMLITAVNSNGKVNTMTASWGGLGIMWGKPVCLCVIRPQRYTDEFVKEADSLTLTFLQDGNRDALKICGSKSGRECDKISEAGLTTVFDGDCAYFSEAKTVIFGKKLYTDVFKEDCFLDSSIPKKIYPTKDYHHIYVCEITKVLTKDRK